MTTPTSGSSEITPSLVRTASPLVVAALGGWLAKHGVGIDNDFVTLLVGALIGWLYYTAARFGEVFISDKWGYVLGFKKKPVYVNPPATVTDQDGTVLVSEDGPEKVVDLAHVGADEEEITNPLHAEDENPLDHVGEDVESFFEAHLPEDKS